MVTPVTPNSFFLNASPYSYLVLSMRSSKTFQVNFTDSNMLGYPRNGISWARAWTAIRENQLTFLLLTDSFFGNVKVKKAGATLIQRLLAGNTFKNSDQRMSLFFLLSLLGWLGFWPMAVCFSSISTQWMNDWCLNNFFRGCFIAT